MARLTKVEGIGETYAQKLAKAGISSARALREKGATRQGRREIAERTGISEGLILRWVNAVDLQRVNGVGAEYTDLLSAAGVDTMRELAQRNPENLYGKLNEVNAKKRLVRRMPGQRQVIEWTDQAARLSGPHGPGEGRPGGRRRGKEWQPPTITY
jgi:predicted flap endonuclease-1-like 5' DNA nuclease